METQNALLTIMRGTEANAYGDESDVGLPLYQHIPAAAVETTKTVFDQASQRQQTVRTTMAVVPYWADVTDSDTILREDTGDYFMVESVTRQPSLLGVPPDLILSLRSRSGVSIQTD